MKRAFASILVAALAVPALALAAHPKKGGEYFGARGAASAIVSKKGGSFTHFTTVDSHCASLPVTVPVGKPGISKTSGRFAYHGGLMKGGGPLGASIKGTIRISGRFVTSKKMVFAYTYVHAGCTDKQTRVTFTHK